MGGVKDKKAKNTEKQVTVKVEDDDPDKEAEKKLAKDAKKAQLKYQLLNFYTSHHLIIW